MNTPLARALLLYHQSRYELAEQEVRRVLGELPHDSDAHALLALCLVQQQKYDDAQTEVEQAIVLAPDSPYAYYCRSVVMEQRQRFAEAEVAAREAIRLDPTNADYYARLATTLFYQEKWKATLEAAVEGLAYDAENEGCNHLRTMALTKLGRQQEAVASVDAVLQRAPDDALAHTNKGWALLNQSKPREALEHFREALRIDPTFSYAQAGIVEALKARNPLYRLMLAYFLWMARLSPRARWGVVVGGFLGYQFLSSVKDQHPQLGPWIVPFLFLYIIFALLTWFAVPLFNMMLRFNKFGWYALSPDKRTASNWFAGCLIIFVGAVIAYFGFGYELAILVAVVAVGIALPLVTRYNCSIGWPRQAMTWYAAVMVLVGAAVIALAAMNYQATMQVAQLFVIGFIATPWLANYLMTVTPTR